MYVIAEGMSQDGTNGPITDKHSFSEKSRGGNPTGQDPLFK